MNIQLHNLLTHWRTFVIVLTPLVIFPLAISEHKEARCSFVVIIMAVYWMTEAVALPITSLLPVVLFPLLGVLGTEAVCVSYLKETNMMFIGGLIVALAVEHCNLHKRIALKTILVIGTSPVRLMLGFMLTTMTLSMWISNTATTAMMVPIVQAVIEELKTKSDNENSRRPSQGIVLTAPTSDQACGVFDEETRRKSIVKDEHNQVIRPDKDTICYYLAIAYSANLGGTGTLTGTGTNLTFKGLYDSIFPKAKGINFASWMIFNVPMMLINVVAAFLWLQFLFMDLFRKKKSKAMKDNSEAVRQMISEKYRELGAMTFHEGAVLSLFILVVLMWFFREPEFIPGWAGMISSVKIKDATPVMLIVFLLFVLPSNLDFLPFNTKDKKFGKPAPSLLTWKPIHEKVPWGLVLLIGGGFAMASACKESGLSKLLGEKLVALQVLPQFLILIIITAAAIFITEVSSNTAVANIVVPVLAEMAVAMKIHPLYFIMPAVLCCSYAFMLPVATPPNAIVLTASNMRTSDMMRAGIGMNLICLFLLCITFPTLGTYVYNLSEFPAYAVMNRNTTIK